MVATHDGHHGATARTGGHDGAAHSVPDIHEGQRSRRVRADAFNARTFGAQRREVITNAAALLHGQRGFFEIVENARHRVGDRAHDETIEERYVTAGACACENAAGGQKAMIR